jgi:hypothetical protein
MARDTVDNIAFGKNADNGFAIDNGQGTNPVFGKSRDHITDTAGCEDKAANNGNPAAEQRAAKIYEGVAEPLTADDVAEAVRWSVMLPHHFNIDLMVIRPLAQAAQHKVVRRG